jgi:molybdopterin molybdotransferase
MAVPQIQHENTGFDTSGRRPRQRKSPGEDFFSKLLRSAGINEALDLHVALERIAAQIQPQSTVESLPIREANGRVLAANESARHPSPPFASSAMDGYALPTAPTLDVRGSRWKIVGESAAGKPWMGHLREGECVRILTGAVVPAGSGRIVLQEDCTVSGEHMVVDGEPEPRDHIRPIGHDIATGEPLVAAGTRLSPIDIGRLAGDGRRLVQVLSRVSVGVFSTGDELVDPDDSPTPLPPGRIYESNRTTLLSMLQGLPVIAHDLGNLPDTAVETQTALREASRQHDFLLTSGGVSVGDHDHVRMALETLGTLSFWKLNLKPGKPLAFGRIGRAWFCGLPGNPVSTIVTWFLIAKPALLRACGATPEPPLRLPAILQSPVSHKPGRTEYQRGFLSWTDNERLPVVRIRGDQSSNRLATFQDANCLVEIPAANGDLPTGHHVTVLLLGSL